LPNFPVAQFSAAHFSGCRFFRGRFRYFRHFCVALFSYHVNFRYRIFLLSNFPVAISSVAVFSVALFSVAIFTFTALAADIDKYLLLVSELNMLRAEIKGSTQTFQ